MLGLPLLNDSVALLSASFMMGFFLFDRVIESERCDLRAQHA